MVSEYSAARTRLTDYMRRKGLKLTRQRETILRAFLSGQKHVAVDELLEQTRKLHPGVGHATVYRTVKLFVEAGIAHEHNFTDGPAQYEPAQPGGADHHDHLICTVCDRIVEFENDEIELLQEQVAEELRQRVGRRLAAQSATGGPVHSQVSGLDEVR